MALWKIISISLLGLVLLVGAAIGGAYGFVQSAAGRDFFARQVEAAVSEPGVQTLQLGRIDGNLFSNFTLSGLILADKDGTWLELEELAVSWSPMALLDGRLKIDDIAAEKLTISRAPDVPPSPEEAKSAGLPGLPLGIKLDRLRIKKIALAAPLVGRAMQLTLNMSLNGEEAGAIQSRLDLRETAGGKGRLEGKAVFTPESRQLAIDAALSEPEGGLLARSLQLPGFPAVKLTLKGKGPLDNWKGSLAGQAGKFIETAFDIKLTGEDVFYLNLTGHSRIDKSLTTDIPLFDGSDIRSAVALTWNRDTGEIRVVSAEIANDVLVATLAGTVNPDKEALDLTAHSKLLKAATVNGLIAPAAIGKAEADFRFSGTFKKVETRGNWHVAEASYPDMAAARTLTGEVTASLPLAKLERIPFQATVKIDGLSGLPDQVLAMLGETPGVTFKGDYRIDASRLTLDQVTLKAAHVSAEGAGHLAPESGETAVKASAIFDDLAAIAGIKGRLDLDLDLSGPDFADDLSGRLKARAEHLDLGDPALGRLIGDAPVLSSDLRLDAEGLIVSNLILDLAKGKVTGEVASPRTFDQVTGKLIAALSDLAALDELAGISLKGAGRLEANIHGAVADPGVTGSLKLSNLNVAGSELGLLDGNFRAKNLASSPAGDFTLSLVDGPLPATVKADFALPDFKRLALSNFTAVAADNNITGNINIPLGGAPYTGDIKVELPEIDRLAAFAGTAAAGTAKGVVKLREKGGEQVIAATLTGQNLQLSDKALQIGKLSANADIVGNLTNPDLKLTAKAEGVSAANMTLTSLDLDASGKKDALDYQFRLIQSESPRANLDGKGHLALQDGGLNLNLAALDGEVADKKLHLSKALSLTQAGETLKIAPFSLAFGEGTVGGSADLGMASARAELAIRQFPVDLLRLLNPDLPLSGRLSGKGSLSFAEGEQASGQFAFDASRLRMEEEGYESLPDFSAHVRGELKADRLAFSGGIEGLKSTNISAAGGMPLALTTELYDISVNKNKPVNLKINMDSNIRGIWPLLALDTQQLDGHLTANVTVTGSIAEPKIAATAGLKDGVYTNLEQGSELRNISVNADVTGNRWLEIEAKAKDAAGGTVTATANVDFAILTDPLLDMKLRLDKLLALNRDDLTVTTDGDIAVKGGLKHLDVKGKVTTRDVEINIGGALAPSIADLKVEEINRPGMAPKRSMTEEKPLLSRIALNLDLSLPRRVFIRGRGLDSEWEGQFTVKGTAKTPLIEGYLSPVRGQFSFAGKNFKLQEGSVRLLGEKDIDPELSLSAKYVASNITALVTISGTTKNPKISFSSPSGLPEDEVLSQVLFGKSSGKLSALEAVQLAETVAVLSGRVNSGGGILGFARKTLGVDVISADTNAETGQAEVNVGKYVTDNVYVGVEQGTETGSTRAKVEIDLTPNISVESEVGQSTDSSVGIFWNWDY